MEECFACSSCMVKAGSTMAQIANKKMAWERFIETQSIWDDVPAIIVNSWGQSWPRVNFSKGLNPPQPSSEHFISANRQFLPELHCQQRSCQRLYRNDRLSVSTDYLR
jgi:hypothetical protein